MRGNELEREIKTIQNMLATVLREHCYLCKDYCRHTVGEMIEMNRPKPEPIKDLKWSDTKKGDELKKEFEDSIPKKGSWAGTMVKGGNS